jgi:hypothetical protein
MSSFLLNNVRFFPLNPTGVNPFLNKAQVLSYSLSLSDSYLINSHYQTIPEVLLTTSLFAPLFACQSFFFNYSPDVGIVDSFEDSHCLRILGGLSYMYFAVARCFELFDCGSEFRAQ